MEHSTVEVRIGTYLIDSASGQLRPRSEFPSGHVQNEIYLRGSLELIVNRVPVLLRDDQDDVNFLWCNVVGGLDDLMESGHAEITYSSGPMSFGMKLTGNELVTIVRGNKRAVVGFNLLASALVAEATAFFEQIEDWGKRIHRCDPAYLYRISQRIRSVP